MIDKKQIVSLADQGFTCARIATELGVSRQRIHQLAQKLGLKLRKDAASPVPRILTIGVIAPCSHRIAGYVAELLAAADLMARGWEVFLPALASRGHDIVCRKSGGPFVTIEVRSATRVKSGRISFQKFDRDKSDHYALVMTGEPVQYQPPLPE